MRSRHRQSGLTIVGFVFVAAVVLSIAMIGFRVLPSYIEYFSVEKTLRQTLTNARDNPTLDQLRKEFDLKASADYIDSVRGSDVEVTREGNLERDVANALVAKRNRKACTLRVQ